MSEDKLIKKLKLEKDIQKMLEIQSINSKKLWYRIRSSFWLDQKYPLIRNNGNKQDL